MTPGVWRQSPFAGEGRLAALSRVTTEGQARAKASLMRVRARFSPKT